MIQSPEAVSSPATTLAWDVGTAYELFVSLHVLYEPERYDLRPSWAAKIRSRIPASERSFLEQIEPFLSFPLGWVHRLPAPKNAITALYALQQIPAGRRGFEIFNLETSTKPESVRLLEIAGHGRWDNKDLAFLVPLMCRDPQAQDEQALIRYLNWWVRPDEFGALLYSGLQAYFQGFFEQEEQRVAPVLQAGLQHAQELAGRLDVPDLLAELSQGIRFTEDLSGELTIVPAYWMTPLIQLDTVGPNQKLFLFGARPATMSVIPGELVPEGLLIALQAVSDPTRLKILRYLSQQELTPSELSRRLNLRAPTVTHHLKELRLAGLINVTVRGQERLYRARLGALDSIHKDLKGFLTGGTANGRH